MKEDIEKLKIMFYRIKSMGLIKSKRKGPTGVGFTFEELINKKEDQKSKPDFYSIEIKCILGYSNSDITLFSCAPKRNNLPCMNYIFNTYGYYKYGNINSKKIFSRKVFCGKTIELYNYSFKLFIDQINKRILMKAFNNDKFQEIVCYWNFEDIKNKLIEKLSTLAVVSAFPYKYSQITYYKYVKIKFYKLIDFHSFLKALDENIICIEFYITQSSDNLTECKDHGVKFRIQRDKLEKLFLLIK